MTNGCHWRTAAHPAPLLPARRRLGQSLAEAMIAVAILTIVIFGAVAFIQTSMTWVDKAMLLRTATEVAQDRLEQAKATAYASLTVGTTTGSTTISGQTYNWTLVVATAQADPGDAASTYKTIQCTVVCAGTQQSVGVRTAVAP